MRITDEIRQLLSAVERFKSAAGELLGTDKKVVDVPRTRSSRIDSRDLGGGVFDETIRLVPTPQSALWDTLEDLGLALRLAPTDHPRRALLDEIDTALATWVPFTLTRDFVSRASKCPVSAGFQCCGVYYARPDELDSDDLGYQGAVLRWEELAREGGAPEQTPPPSAMAGAEGARTWFRLRGNKRRHRDAVAMSKREFGAIPREVVDRAFAATVTHED